MFRPMGHNQASYKNIDSEETCSLHAECIYGFRLILKETQTHENALTNWSLNIQVSIDVTPCPLLNVFFSGEVLIT